MNLFYNLELQPNFKLAKRSQTKPCLIENGDPPVAFGGQSWRLPVGCKSV